MSAMTGVSALPVRPRPRAPGKLPLQSMLATAENSWKTTLMEDPKSQKGSPNTEPREVFGHWVDVVPTALPDPFLVAVAPSMLAELGLDPAAKDDPSFAQFFSGDVSAARKAGLPINPWATPYAVSVFGQPIPSPDPFGKSLGAAAEAAAAVALLLLLLQLLLGWWQVAADTACFGSGHMLQICRSRLLPPAVANLLLCCLLHLLLLLSTCLPPATIPVCDQPSHLTLLTIAARPVATSLRPRQRLWRRPCTVARRVRRAQPRGQRQQRGRCQQRRGSGNRHRVRACEWRRGQQRRVEPAVGASAQGLGHHSLFARRRRPCRAAQLDPRVPRV